jgi:hypothetical protein
MLTMSLRRRSTKVEGNSGCHGDEPNEVSKLMNTQDGLVVGSFSSIANEKLAIKKNNM